MYNNCRICGRPLRAYESRRRGVGPKCGGYESAKIHNDALRRSDWRHEYHGDVLVIYDLNLGGMSVTNDMDNILEILKVKPGQRIIYMDSEGIFDGVELKESRAVSFYPVRETNLQTALEKIKL